MEYIFMALFILALPLVLYCIFKPVMEDRKVRNNITNSDPFMRHYWFSLDCDEQEALNQLRLCNIYDPLAYTLDEKARTIVFSHLGASIEHRFTFYVIESKTYLKVSRVRVMHDRSNIPYMINRFFVKKLGATPVDYNTVEMKKESAKDEILNRR